jgi:phosphate transport system substrate-binding protein
MKARGKMMISGIRVFGFLCSFLIASNFTSAQEYTSIQIKGSDTMVNLGQAWAEAYLELDPDAFIAVTGGGSGTGIAALINGTCDIAQASREISEKETSLAAGKSRTVEEVIAAIDAVALVVHPDNPVDQLNIHQLSDIYTRKVTNWKDVGGLDQPILVLSRERNSGTHIFMLQKVVRRGKKKGPEEFAPEVLMMSSSQAIEQEVADNPAAIGYFGMGYLGPRVKALGVAPSDSDAFVKPTIAHSVDGTYLLARPLRFYLPGVPAGAVKDFIDFVLSEKGQSIVLDMDFVPLPKVSA